MARVKSSHPDQYFPTQINPLQDALRGRCFLGPVCGSFARILQRPVNFLTQKRKSISLRSKSPSDPSPPISGTWFF